MTQEHSETSRRRGESFWRRTLKAQRHSGLSQVEFCRRNDLAVSTFQYWRRRLREMQPETGTAATPDFVEVALRPEPAVPQPAAADGRRGFELTFPSGLQLRVPLDVEGRALAEVLWALEVAGSC